MKKITKKIAALTAAVMALTALGSMSVYAEIPDVITEDEEKTVTLPYALTINERESGTKVPAYVGSGRNDDSSKHIWCIDVIGNEFNCISEWTAIMNKTQDYIVQWNLITRKYERVYTGEERKVLAGLVKRIDFFSNGYINRSNFSIDWTLEISNPSTMYNTLEENGVVFSCIFNSMSGTEDVPITNKTLSRSGTLTTDEFGDQFYARIDLKMDSELTSEQVENIYKAYLDEKGDGEDVRLLDMVMSFTPSSDPIPFEEGGDYDKGNLPG